MLAAALLVGSVSAGPGLTALARAAVARDGAAIGPLPAACPDGSTRIEPGQSIQARVDKGAPGAVFCIAAGRHRGQSIAPKDGQRFIGEGGAVLDGTVALKRFGASPPFWAAILPLPPMPPQGTCAPASPGCNRPEAVFLDGRPLVRVDRRDALTPGHFMIDETRHVLLAENPAGRQVDAIVERHAILANGARDITVANLVIENYGSPAQHGAVFDSHDARATGWIIEHNEVRANSGLGILAGPGARIRANKINDNGQLGVSVSDAGVVIDGNEIAGNNTRGFDPQWEAGGVKAALASGLVLRGNDVHHNHGPGLWGDIECRDTVYEGNRVSFNDGAGIFHEISFAASIRNNIVRQNGVVDQGWYWGANILVAASQNVVVENNQIDVADGGTGIALVDQGRPRASGGFYKTSDNMIRGNIVRFAGPRASRMGGVSDTAADSANDGIIERGRNRFERNRYIIPPGTSVEFGWGKRTMTFAQFQALGQERSSALSDVVP